MKNKDKVVWFVNMKDAAGWAAQAKVEQLKDWINKENPFGTKYDVIIVPSEEDKITILKSNDDFRNEFSGDPDEWLCRVKDKLEDCPTIRWPLQNGDDERR